MRSLRRNSRNVPVIKMPREIADSDDELDIISPPRTNNAHTVEDRATPGSLRDLDQLDPVLNTAFDDFLSPTQRLSSYDGNHEDNNDIDTSKFIDSSTNRFLEALAPSSNSPSQNTADANSASQLIDPDMGGKQRKDKATVKETAGHKRSWTDIEEGRDLAKQNESTKKKAKTARGSSLTTSLKSKDALDLEGAMYDGMEATAGSNEQYGGSSGDMVAHPHDMVSIDARTDYTSPLDLSLHLSPSNGAQVTANTHLVTANPALASYVPHQPYTSQGDFFGANLRGGTTSNSSMGNYQSFSINPEKLGMDFDKINPFGSLSQVSLPGDLESDETRGIADIFRNSASHSTRASFTNETEMSNDTVHGIEDEMQTSPLKSSGARRTTKNRKTEQDDAQCSPPFSPITNPDDQNTIDDNVASRRRDQGAHIMVDVPELKPVPKKRGRKPKNQKAIEASDAEQAEIDELHLEEQLFSRATRAGTVDSVSNASEISQATNSGKTGRKRKVKKSDMGPPDSQSKKLPSSDLGLDNKAVIGLSPERYVPRPSKRRGRADVQAPDLHGVNSALAEEKSGPVDDADIKVVATKGKKGKKGKAKGPGRPSAASTKQNGELNTEDARHEVEEVTDEQLTGEKAPSPSPLEISPEQKPDVGTILDEDDEDKDDVVVRSNGRRPNISIDVPVLPKSDDQQELAAPVPEPKKRGRKRKKAVEEAPADIKDDESQRPALSEKDPNIQVGKKTTVTVTADDNLDQEKEKVDEAENETKHDGKLQTPAPQNDALMAGTPGKMSSTPSKSLSSTPLFNARARIGLSKRHSIPSLLRKVDRNKEAPKVIERKEKLNKARREEIEQERIAREEAEAEGREYKPLDQLRDKDGRLVEWDF